MKLFKKIMAIVLSSAMLFSFAGCSKDGDGKYIAEYKGLKIEKGVYIVQMMSAYMEASKLVPDPKKEVLDQEIEGKDANDWIIEKTKEYMAENFAILSKFKEQGKELTAEQIKMIEDSTNQQWSYLGSVYEKNGISKDDMKAINTINAKASAAFEVMYSEGGEKEVSAKEIQKVYDEDYIKIGILPMMLTDKEGKPLSEAEAKAVKDKAQGYADRINKGEDIEKLVDEYELGLLPKGQEPPKDNGKHSIVLNKKIQQNLPPEFVDAVDKAEVNKAFVYDDGNFVIVALNIDKNKDKADLNEAKLSILMQLKGEDFSKFIKENAKEIKPKYDSILTAKLSPKFVYANAKTPAEQQEKVADKDKTEEKVTDKKTVKAEVKPEKETK